MSLRRAITLLIVIPFAFLTLGCGVAEDYEGGAVLLVTSVDDTTATATRESISGDELNFNLQNFNRLGVGDNPIDLHIFQANYALFDSEPGSAPIYSVSQPESLFIPAGGSGSINVAGIIPTTELARIVAAVDDTSVTLEDYYTDAYTLRVVFAAKTFSGDRELGDTVHASGSATIVIDKSGIVPAAP